MATERQIRANRRNALKSTGPRTAAGKAASSRSHGLTAHLVVIDGGIPPSSPPAGLLRPGIEAGRCNGGVFGGAAGGFGVAAAAGAAVRSGAARLDRASGGLGVQKGLGVLDGRLTGSISNTFAIQGDFEAVSDGTGAGSAPAPGLRLLLRRRWPEEGVAGDQVINLIKLPARNTVWYRLVAGARSVREDRQESRILYGGRLSGSGGDLAWRPLVARTLRYGRTSEGSREERGSGYGNARRKLPETHALSSI
jgi:hypothetical protein